MRRTLALTLAFLPAAFLFVSCGNDSDLPPMVSAGSADQGRADTLFAAARKAEDAGRTKKAIGLYDEIARKIPFATNAPEARFRQAKLLDESGETLDAFDAYQDLITRYQGSGLYDEAYKRQTEMAFAAADGEIKTSFLGLKSKLSAEKVAGMLEKVAGNAPRSNTAARAHYKIGDVLVAHKKVPQGLAAYRKVVVEYPNSPHAPEAQFRIGEVLLTQAREGNQDQANLSRAKEAFQDYLSQYPGHHRNKEARQLIANIGGRDLQNTYDIAVFYENKGDIGSAKFYYQDVVKRAKSGDLHDKAQARLSALGGN